MKKHFAGVLMVFFLMWGCISLTAEAATTTCTTYSGENVENQDYARYASPIDSYLSVQDGGLMRVQYVSGTGVVVEYYDNSYNILSTKTIAAELPIFGGFYETDTNYFLLTGQLNSNEDDSVEVYRITKYDKNWTRIGSAGLYGANTTEPFRAGSARMDTLGKYLLIRTSHQMYKSGDGLNHQANVTIQLDMETMTITEADTAVMNNSYGYVSHSFNQFIKIEDNKIVAVDHGDAHPRSIGLIKYNTDASDGTFYPDYSEPCNVINVLTFPGASGENVTGASVGGFEISSSAYLVAGNSVVQDESNLTRVTRNAFVASVDKSTSAVTINWLTDYAEGEETVSTPHLVKIADNSYLVLWSRNDTVYYRKLDGAGQLQGEVYSLPGNLSDCVPVVANGKLIWYTWNREIVTFYDIDLTDLSKSQVTEIVNGHRYENLGITDGYASLKCSVCTEEKSLKVATSVNVGWKEEGETFYMSPVIPAEDRKVGNTVSFLVNSVSPSDADSTLEIFVSDPEVISYKQDDSNPSKGTLTMLKVGTATLTIRPKYNPDAALVYTFAVADHDHEYEWQETVDAQGITIFQCKHCDKSYTMQVGTEMVVGWNTVGGFSEYAVSAPAARNVGEDLYYLCNLTPSDANYDIEVIIEDEDIVSYTPTYTTQRMGKFTMLKTGTTKVTFRPKYNPALAQTYTIKVNGELAVESFTVDKASPQQINTAITLTAEAVGGSWSYQYKFYEKDEAGAETLIRDYDSANTCTWNPGTAGTRTLYVDVNDGNETVVTKSITYEVLDFKITRATLKLENDITVIFKAPASYADVYKDIYVEIVKEKENGDTEKQKVTGVKGADGAYIEFYYTGVNAKEVGDNLDATIYGYNADGILVTGKTQEDFSVKEYCMGQLSKSKDELGLSEAKHKTFQTLMVDLLNYAAEAQKYFKYKENTPVNADLSATQKEYGSKDAVLEGLQDITDTKYVAITAPTAAWEAAGLNLLSKTNIRLKFAYEGDISNVTLTAEINGRAQEVTIFSTAGDKQYYAFFDGLTAYQYGMPIDFTLKADGVAISDTLRYSVESYAVYNKEDATIGGVVSAMMKYGKAAVAYNETD